MFIGEKIAFFRNLRGMTQKILGLKIGFPQNSADVRIAQYECGARSPKSELIRTFALALGVSPYALRVPDSKDPMLLMHILFDLEDSYGFRVQMIDGKPCLYMENAETPDRQLLLQLLTEWYEQEERLASGELLQDEYDEWRYLYPMYDTEEHRPSQNYLNRWFETVEAFKETESKCKKSKARIKASKEIHSDTESFNEEYIAAQQAAGLLSMVDESEVALYSEENTDSVQNNLNGEPTAKKSKRYRVIRGFKR